MVFLLGITLLEEFWTWVVIIVNGIEDNVMCWDIIRVVKVVILLLLGSKLGYIWTIFYKDVVGIDSKLRGMENGVGWRELLVEDWVVFEDPSYLVMALAFSTLRMASSLANTYCSNSSMESSYVGSISSLVSI